MKVDKARSCAAAVEHTAPMSRRSKCTTAEGKVDNH